MAIETSAKPQIPELLERASVPELDAILGRKFPVLDDGFVRVVDYMGTDAAIVQAARVSYGTGTKKTREDRGLIRYLLRHQHTTPFEMCDIKFHVRVPMDTWRQWVRHRTASVNEYSTRYSIAIDDKQQTPADAWRTQSSLNRQGSDGFLDTTVGEHLTTREREFQDLGWSIYQERIDAGVAREQARKDLPLSTYTEAYWKVNLHNLLHFLWLRMDTHAQLEIRDYATTIGEEIVARWCPIAWDAFKDYRFNSLQLTAAEIAIVQATMANGKDAGIAEAESRGFITRKDGVLKLNREAREIDTKLNALGIDLPWS
ncbi:MAG: FAD-dependent thymidylate synthase [Thermomicrobiales bacterium]